MSDLKVPGDPKKPVSVTRIAVWVIVAAIGGYTLLSGILGIIAKG